MSLNIVLNWGGRIRTYEWRSQSPQPYRLATPQNSNTGQKIAKYINNLVILVLGKKGFEPLTP